MESNITDQQYFGTDLQLQEPHFDEEATLLSARPVVPLSDVRVEASSGRRLAFGLAIVVAIIAGALAATLIYKQSDQKQATIVETGTPVAETSVLESEPLSGAGGAISGSDASSVAEDADEGATREVHRDGAAADTRKASPPFSAKSGLAKETLQNGAGNRPDEREMRRAERMEARRLRRNAEREARGHRSQSSDDLLRIREIFEGSPRP